LLLSPPAVHFRSLLLLSLLSACRTPGQHPDGTVNNVERRLSGVWRAAAVTTTGKDRSSTNQAPPPSLFILTQSHYSQIYEAADTARADFAGPRPSDIEKIAAFDSFVANGGTYRVEGNVLVLQPTVAKRPRPANGYWTIPHEFRIRGDTLFTIDHGPSGSGPLEFRVTWIRIE
jgi:hypothetical protein